MDIFDFEYLLFGTTAYYFAVIGHLKSITLCQCKFSLMFKRMQLFACFCNIIKLHSLFDSGTLY